MSDRTEWSKITYDKLRKMIVEDNKSNNDIANYYGISPSSVSKKRKLLGLSQADLIYEEFIKDEGPLMEMINQRAMNWFMDEKNINLMAKAITNYTLRSSPLENIHTDKRPITDKDMKSINIFMVNHIAGLLVYALKGDWLRLQMLLEFCSYGTSEWYEAVPVVDEIAKMTDPRIERAIKSYI